MPTSPEKGRPLPRVRIKGGRGDWTAEVDGERLAVLHTSWLDMPSYRDPMGGVKVEGKRYGGFLQALRSTDRAVLQRDKGDGSLARDGYVGVFSFKDLHVDPAGAIELTLVERVAEPRR